MGIVSFTTKNISLWIPVDFDDKYTSARVVVVGGVRGVGVGNLPSGNKPLWADV